MIPTRLGAVARALAVLAALAAGSLAAAAATSGAGARLQLALGLLALLLAGVVVAQWLDAREQDRRQRLVANGLAHRVRTPLAHIRAYNEMLLLGRDQTAEERAAWLEVIEREAHRLEELTENLLLAVTPPEARTFPSRRPIDLGGLLEDVAADFAACAAGDCRPLILADPPQGVHVLVDPRSVRQAVNNLLDNAVRYGTPGQPVTVSLHTEGRDAVICVANRGQRILPRDRRQIWRPFVCLQASGSTEATCGLGLAVVEHVARLHGGRAFLADGPSGETRFCLVLPLAARPAPGAQPAAAREAAVLGSAGAPSAGPAGPPPQ